MALDGETSVAASSGPTLLIDVGFDSSFNNAASPSGGVVTSVGSCTDVASASLPCNATEQFDTDSLGTFWTWTTGRHPGGGLYVTTSDVVDEYTLGIRFSFAQVSSYRKIVDYLNRADDTGFYVEDGYVTFYDLGESDDKLVAADQVVDLLAVRSVSNGQATFTVCLVNSDGLTEVLAVADPTNESKPHTLFDGGSAVGSLFGLFFDDTDTNSEYSSSGRVYGVRLWDGPLAKEAVASAMGAPLDGSTPGTSEQDTNVLIPPPPPASVSTTTTTPTTTTTVPPTTVPPTTVPAASTTVPAPVPDGDALPVLVPGASQVLENGVPASVEVFVDNSTDLVLRGQSFELRLAGECSSGCTIDTTADGRQVLTLEEGGRANVSGEGFQPGTTVFVWLFSEPRFLGQLTVAADGTFQGSVALGDIASGEHTLQVNGTSTDGSARTANLGVVVNPAAAPMPGPGVLPATGVDASSMWLVALVLLGVGLVAVGRRRAPAPR
jgi:LPXTG-motif cell wall-anchored protein